MSIDNINIIMKILCLTFLISCNEQIALEQNTVNAPRTNEQTSQYKNGVNQSGGLHANFPKIYELKLGQPAINIEHLAVQFNIEEIFDENGRRQIYQFLYRGQSVEADVDELGNIYSLTILEGDIEDVFGSKIGTKLSELKENYPDGRFIIGREEDLFANFITPGHLIFEFDVTSFPADCFEFPKECNYQDGLQYVEQIFISKFNYSEYVKSLPPQ